MQSLGAGSHQNRTGTQSAFLCDPLQCDISAHAFEGAANRHRNARKLAHALLLKNMVPRDMMLTNAQSLSSAFGVLLMYWHQQQISKAVRFECGAGNTPFPHHVLVRITFYSIHLLLALINTFAIAWNLWAEANAHKNLTLHINTECSRAPFILL